MIAKNDFSKKVLTEKRNFILSFLTVGDMGQDFFFCRYMKTALLNIDKEYSDFINKNLKQC